MNLAICFLHMLPHYEDPERSEEFRDSPKKFHRDGSVSDEERQANQFAARLLMPAKMVRAEASKLKDEYRQADGKLDISRRRFIDNLAETFQVSSQAMEYRLKNLRVIA
jgi:Zn-dependent peptidase ImmA (M78 family)